MNRQIEQSAIDIPAGGGIFAHYRALWFFMFNRKKGENKKKMGRYFARLVMTELEEFTRLEEKKLLDVGGGRGFFCLVFKQERNCAAINLEPFPKEIDYPETVQGMGHNLPFPRESFDIVLSRGVLEHIPPHLQQPTVNDMYRVTRRGGLCYILIPPWYNPHAGHNLKPFHILPFTVAKRLRRLVFGNKIVENSYAEAHLYKITFRRMKKMIETAGFEIAGVKDTHLRLHFMARIPVLRELFIPAAAFIAFKR
jgi:SAM-dependent methyltransferase